MRFGLFCTYENPQQHYALAYAEQTELVQLIEDLGFDEAWIAEHHFNANASSSSAFPILAYLAGRTSRLRLGSAAILLPFHDPLTVAEDVATVDLLSEGRFDFGVAKGGPFPIQNKHFHVGKDDARPRMEEALQLIQRLLAEDAVSLDGSYFKADGVELVPKPVQRPVPTFIATSTVSVVEMAARQDYGLMAAPPFPIANVLENLRHYRAVAPSGDPKLVIIRFFHLAPTRDQAVAEARELLQPFVERMRISTAKMQPDWTEWMVLDRLIEDSLIGTEADVGARIAALHETLHPRSLVLKPLSPQFGKRRSDLRVFAENILPSYSEIVSA